MEATAFAPGHITCFFSAYADREKGPAVGGSRGAGFCTASGVQSQAAAGGGHHPVPPGGGLPFELVVKDNGTLVDDPLTTRLSLEALAGMAPAGTRVPRRLEIRTTYSLPIGAGFGISGACALSTTLAANEALGLGLPFADCVTAAHIGEVEAQSGLGDVVAQATGGFEARVREGVPPTGSLKTFPVGELPLLLVSFGPLHTREFLAKRDRLASVNAAGEACLTRLLAAPSIESAVRLGREFAGSLGLISNRALALMDAAPTQTDATVAMLGDSVVFLRPPPGLEAIAREAGAQAVERTHVARTGARLGPGGPPEVE
jgi:pantoate kinase